ncbi:MAG: peptidylprolyl isomerase [Ignavibacteriaceae bacterium]|nr:peptidylprolyl isomerase [Ignavibacteriaceae bacterium]
MILKRVLLPVMVIAAVILSGCTTPHSEIVLVKFGNDKITMGEFEQAYAKNAGGIEKAKKDSIQNMENFLKLYTNFRLKLKDANARGYDTNPELRDELLDYKKKVGVTYILEKQLVEPSIKKLYEERKTEFRVSHLMIRPDTSGEEAARVKTQDLLNRMKAGESFEQLVAEHSHDNFSKTTGGDIYYITAGMLIPEFEEAVYKTQVGGIYSEVVKTKYGYHIIKVTEKRERIPQVRASHIMVDYYSEGGEVDSAAAKARIDSVYTMLQNGGDFAKLAADYSEDQGSKANGGDLNYFERRMMVKEFDEAAFNLKPGEISKVISTSFGYHIIKLTERKPYPGFEDDKENLKRIYKQTRYNRDYDQLIDQLKKKYNYSSNQAVIAQVAELGDSLKMAGDYWKAEWRSTIGGSILFSYDNKNVILDTFFTKVDALPEYQSKLINKTNMEDAVKKVSGDLLLENEALNLDKTNSEFAALMTDYQNGIYIFKLQDDEVWGKIELDSVRLVEHYEKTKEKYRWDDRIELSEIHSKSDSLIKHYHSLLKKGEDFDTLAAKHTERPGFKEKAGRFQLLSINSSQLSMEANKLNNPGDFSEPFPMSGGYSIVKLIRKEPARIKTFEEARAEVSGSFQEEESKRLENSYVDRLYQTYKPVTHSEELGKAFKGEK